MPRDEPQALPGEMQQLLHGYRRGHEQMAGSVRLPPGDAELVTRLSDLSGSLSGSPKFGPYLTTYPLQGGQYQAVAKTWPDLAAPRAGCVLTHTILVPTALWKALEDPLIIDEAFRDPTSEPRPDYSCPITLPKKSTAKPVQPLRSNPRNVLTFVRKYFAEGRRPVVWFGHRQPDQILWHLLRGMWPNLRAAFSSCTFCLQPRTLNDRIFELMFAPPSAYARFLKIGPESFIDASETAASNVATGSEEPWIDSWADRLFGSATHDELAEERDLWAELDDDPTAIRRVFLIDGLMNNPRAEPQMLVGAMDLVESLAKEGSAALGSKRRIADRAVAAAREASDPETGLECLRLIGDRLRHTSFERVQDSVGTSLQQAVARYTASFPGLTLQSFSPATDLSESWFGRGALAGFRALAQHEPDRLLALRDVSGLVGVNLMADPEVGAALVRAAASLKDYKQARADLLRWLASINDRELRGALRKAMVPAIGADDGDILYELLRDVRKEEVSLVLDGLSGESRALEAQPIRDVAIAQIARNHPDATRAWARQLTLWTSAAAEVLASAYPPTRHGMTELLDFNAGFPKERRAEAVALFVRTLGSGKYPYWLRELVREKSSLLSVLLDSVDSQLVSEQIEKLLREEPALRVAESAEVLRKVLAASRCSFFPDLLETTMRSLITSFVAGTMSEADSRPFQEQESAASWFRSADVRSLKALVTNDTTSSHLRWFNAWRWTALAPRVLYERDPTPLTPLIDSLCRFHYSGWSSEIASMWCQILRRCRRESRSEGIRLSVYAEALHFALENNRFPLSSVVAETFHYVYAAVTASTTCPPEAAPMFSRFDWDKGKELRGRLVDSFYYSQWPPGDLVIAAREIHLLRKIFKRLLRKPAGERYAQAATVELEKRTDDGAATLLEVWRGLLAEPDFYEEWV